MKTKRGLTKTQKRVFYLSSHKSPCFFCEAGKRVKIKSPHISTGLICIKLFIEHFTTCFTLWPWPTASSAYLGFIEPIIINYAAVFMSAFSALPYIFVVVKTVLNAQISVVSVTEPIYIRKSFAIFHSNNPPVFVLFNYNTYKNVLQELLLKFA